MEEFDEGTITTGIDKFIRILYERRRVELNEASRLLNIPAETIEYWSYVLEGNGLVKINYTLTAVYIEWIGSG
jgi:hypothetical protein